MAATILVHGAKRSAVSTAAYFSTWRRSYNKHFATALQHARKQQITNFKMLVEGLGRQNSLRQFFLERSLMQKWLHFYACRMTSNFLLLYMLSSWHDERSMMDDRNILPAVSLKAIKFKCTKLKVHVNNLTQVRPWLKCDQQLDQCSCESSPYGLKVR